MPWHFSSDYKISTANQQSLFQWNRLFWFVCIVLMVLRFFSAFAVGPIVFLLFSSAPFVSLSLCVHGWFRKLFMERIYKLRIRMSLYRVYSFNQREGKNGKLYTKKWEVILNLHSQKKKIAAQKKHTNKTRDAFEKNCLCESVWVCYDILWFIYFLWRQTHTRQIYLRFLPLFCTTIPLWRRLHHSYYTYAMHAYAHCLVHVKVGNSLCYFCRALVLKSVFDTVCCVCSTIGYSISKTIKQA